jgi:hypothetical protein
MSYERQAADEIVFSWQGAPDYTRPAADEIILSWADGAASIGGILLSGTSLSYKLISGPYETNGVGGLTVSGLSDFQKIPNAIGLGGINLSGLGLGKLVPHAIGTGGLLLSDLSDFETNYRALGIGSIDLSGNGLVETTYRTEGFGGIELSGPGLAEQSYRSVGLGAINLAGFSDTAIGLISIQPNYLSTHYRCYLNDLELPIKSFQYRINPSRRFGSVVLAGADRFASEINARINGTLRIEKIYNYANGSSQSFLMFTIPFLTLRLDGGGRSGITGTLTGDASNSNVNPQSIDLFNPSVYGSSNGAQRRYRCDLDPRVRPGDTATINGDTFTVGRVVWYVDATTAIAEISEEG